MSNQNLNTVVHGDALDILKQFDSSSADAFVTDPPFGIGFRYETQEDHDTPADYWQWLSPIHAEMERILKPGGFMAIWQPQKYFRYYWDWYGTDIHIYAACRNFTQMRRTAINYSYDPVVIRYKPGAAPLRPDDPPRNVDFFVANSAKYVSNTSAIEREHPCPRPIDAVEEIIRNFTLPKGVVIDPFLGSGTTAVACLNTGRQFIGIEKNATYHDLSLRRIQLSQYHDLISF